MDFEFAAEHEAFRKEFRGWLAANLPPALCIDDAADDRVASDRETFERRCRWQKTMHAAGWVGVTWPKEYGGRGVGLIERVISTPFRRERARSSATSSASGCSGCREAKPAAYAGSESRKLSSTRSNAAG